MTAHKVTQADRELFKVLYGYSRQLMGPYVDTGQLDENPNMQAIAAHRIAAEQSRDDVIEECAKVAADLNSYSDDNEGVAYDQGIETVVDAIRAMKGSKT